MTIEVQKKCRSCGILRDAAFVGQCDNCFLDFDLWVSDPACGGDWLAPYLDRALAAGNAERLAFLLVNYPWAIRDPGRYQETVQKAQEGALRNAQLVASMFLCRPLLASTQIVLSSGSALEIKDQISHLLMVLEGVWGLFAGSTGESRTALDDALRRLDMNDSKVTQQGAGETTAIAQEVNRLFLMAHAMWTLIKDRCSVTDKQLLDAVQEIDLRDGKCDGKVAAGAPKPCKACGRILSRKAFVCIYCGASVHRELFQP